MVIDEPNNFVKMDDCGEFIVLDIEKTTSAIRDKHRNDLIFLILGVNNNLLQASLV